MNSFLPNFLNNCWWIRWNLDVNRALQRSTKLTAILKRDRKHAVVDEIITPCSPRWRHIWLEDDWQRCRTSCVRSRGENCRLRSPGCWPESWLATSGANILLSISRNHKWWLTYYPSQFTTWLSATLLAAMECFVSFVWWSGNLLLYISFVCN